MVGGQNMKRILLATNHILSLKTKVDNRLEERILSSKAMIEEKDIRSQIFTNNFYFRKMLANVRSAQENNDHIFVKEK